jgi:hypothetical protein
MTTAPDRGYNTIGYTYKHTTIFSVHKHSELQAALYTEYRLPNIVPNDVQSVTEGRTWQMASI